MTAIARTRTAPRTTSAAAGRSYGYARVSTTDQNLEIQGAVLREAGCDAVRAEKVTGTTREGRTELATLLDFLRAGDTLMVTRIDRLARSIGDLQDIVRQLRAKGVHLRATEQPVPRRGSCLSLICGWRG